MKFYLAYNGFNGYGPVHCYVYAESELKALELAREAFEKDAGYAIHGEKYAQNIELNLLIDTEVDKESFYTDVED